MGDTNLGGASAKRAVVYCRASKKNWALEHQIEEGSNAASELGFQVVDTFKDIGSKPMFQRKGIKRLLEMARCHQIDVVLADDIFTLSGFGLAEDEQKFVDYVALLDELAHNGVRVHYVDLPSKKHSELLFSYMLEKSKRGKEASQALENYEFGFGKVGVPKEAVGNQRSNIEPSILTRILAKYIAIVVRNELEDFHCKYLSDDQMRELNPLIRDGICSALHAYFNYHEYENATGFVNWNFFNIPDYWEEPQINSWLRRESGFDKEELERWHTRADRGFED